ncbi:hypothetical protein J2W35_005579 [Variovorax boronicumulans]|uniref:hypothetical protein n=1 Tax=Variovorax boronicumulans TaxID=436515 RepID=UPI0027850716|nr:hypothetical protein [Variovorax boronicumulans]MDQ0085200.1 hypothetical protein [Variovorax boronicumulans]
MRRVIATVLMGALVALPAAAQVVRVASWNLGWHMSATEAPQWIAKCSRSYKKDPATKVWRLTADNAPRLNPRMVHFFKWFALG